MSQKFSGFREDPGDAVKDPMRGRVFYEMGLERGNEGFISKKVSGNKPERRFPR
jgi:hypothetical protein